MPTIAKRKTSAKAAAATKQRSAATRESRSKTPAAKRTAAPRHKDTDRTTPSDPTRAVRAKLFQNGRSQAVRLPKEFRFEGKEVQVSRQGNSILLTPVEAKTTRQYWDEYFRALEPYWHIPFPDCEDDTVTQPEDIFAEGWV